MLWVCAPCYGAVPLPYLEKIFCRSSSVLVYGRFRTNSLPESARSSSSSSSPRVRPRQALVLFFRGPLAVGMLFSLNTSM